ncbi:hypothetical protein LCGC14_1486650 [marine sediment metagenome]|uniref:Uncharacterized protein n=1 Tax=marine sediment metagenome TaxID=412755 RepID=A0A0F9M9V1_9ZZZZ
MTEIDFLFLGIVIILLVTILVSIISQAKFLMAHGKLRRRCWRSLWRRGLNTYGDKRLPKRCTRKRDVGKSCIEAYPSGGCVHVGVFPSDEPLIAVIDAKLGRPSPLGFYAVWVERLDDDAVIEKRA